MKSPSRSRIDWKRWVPLAVVILAVFAAGIAILASSGTSGTQRSAVARTDAEMSAARDGIPRPDVDALRIRLGAAGVESYPELMRDLLAIEDASVREPLLVDLIQNWLDQDMEGFVAFMDEMEVEDGDSYLWERMSRALAAAIPMVGDEAASDPHLGEIVRRLVEFTAETDPRKALEWTRQWLLEDARESALARISGELAKTSPEEAILILEEIRTPARRVDSIKGIGAAYAARDPDAAVQWATHLSELGERPYAMESVVSALADSDPARAAKEIDAFQAFLSADYTSRVLAETGQDPAAAFEGDPSDRETAPPPSDPRLIILADANLSIARQWASSSPEEAVAWVEKLPRSRFRDDMVAGALAGWARKDPASALAYYQANGGENPTAAKALFESWAASDPNAAAASIASLASDDQKVRATEGVAGAWLARDPVRAAAWAGGLPNGRAADVANVVIVDGISVEEPEVAWELARRIENPSDRHSALETSFAGLIGADPGFAQSVLKDANLTESESLVLARMLQSATGETIQQ